MADDQKLNEQEGANAENPDALKEIYCAGGCFWGLEHYFSLVPGVVATEVGYANGKTKQPSYEEVCHRNTGHAETVKVVYDAKRISLKQLLALYYKVIDPVSLNRQGNDVGTQYRTGIYYVDPLDKLIIDQSLADLQKRYSEPIAVEAMPLLNYYPAEAYHQAYLEKHPHGYCHISKDKFAIARTANKYRPMSKTELKTKLSKLQYAVTQKGVTEPPFRNEYYNQFEPGIYVDVISGEPLFVSTDKFESGCGWPSFSKPINNNVIKELADNSLGMRRVEVRSLLSNAHLGHVFQDGLPEQGGLRYCINSAALKFVPKAQMAAQGYEDLLPLIKGN